MISKRGISAVVTTVLLILVSIIAVVLIAGFIIPMIRDSLKEGTSCFDLKGYLTILENEYSCYNSTTSRVMIERGMQNFSISAVSLSAMAGGSSRSIIINSTSMPLAGEAKTYYLGIANANLVKIAAVTTDGKTCDPEAFVLQHCE